VYREARTFENRFVVGTSTMRAVATWTVFACVSVLGVAAAVDALLGDGVEQTTISSRQATEVASSSGETVLPRCRDDQLDLVFESLGGDAAVGVYHAGDEPCHLARTRMTLSIAGNGTKPPGRLFDRSAFDGDFYPGTAAIHRFLFAPSCRERGPFIVTARAGHLREEAPLPGRLLPCGP
jgi:hypothetical protein